MNPLSFFTILSVASKHLYVKAKSPLNNFLIVSACGTHYRCYVFY